MSPLKITGRIGTGRRADPGRFDYEGRVVLQPLSSEGRLELAAVPVHAFKAYFQEALNNIDVRRAFAGYRGSVRYDGSAGLSLALEGDASLEDFRARSATLTEARALGDSGNELLSWKSLALRGVRLSMAEAKAPSVEVKETTLTDFFARVIVDEAGRLNLQDLIRPPGERDRSQPPRSAAALAATPTAAGEASIEIKPAAGDAPITVPAGPDPVGIETRREAGGTTVTTRTLPPQSAGAAAVANSDAAARSGSGLAPVVRFGPILLVNGRVDFTDNFVKPNYSADLTQLGGKLSAFSSAPVNGAPALAELELRGKAQQTAALEITGKLNPLAKPLELDITARMSDLDLPPLSPYSVRYAGHGIERGKLSMEVHYTVQPSGQLTASNKLVLRQLRFGDEIKGAPNSLPVRLAVALLADRNGVIDIDFPISGSLNDPQFSLGPLIFKAFANLIVKAVASPFSLLTGGFGSGAGGTGASTIDFPPGSAVLPSESVSSLEKVAKALGERPALTVTITGMAGLEQERDAYQRRRLRDLAAAEKRRIAARGGGAVADVAAPTDGEYPELLAAVYKRADIAKPRNALGLAKDLSVTEMEALLLPGIPVGDNAMRDLALQRGGVVRDRLLELGLDGARLFLGAVRLGASGESWRPGAELSLATQ
ncbi:MAG: DUF748 domain-containing protein [Comamonadaceae bacterium]|nr:MAG: DUF748 domain-containing protein [Comamonadaceae bacterium]